MKNGWGISTICSFFCREMALNAKKWKIVEVSAINSFFCREIKQLRYWHNILFFYLNRLWNSFLLFTQPASNREIKTTRWQKGLQRSFKSDFITIPTKLQIFCDFNWTKYKIIIACHRAFLFLYKNASNVQISKLENVHAEWQFKKIQRFFKIKVQTKI